MEGETNQLINKKINSALMEKLNVIFCIGESINEKRKNNTFSILRNQIKGSISKKFDLKRIIICGGGRLNQAILNNLKKDRFIISLMEDVKSSQSDDPIWNLNGDFIESQAFAYIAVRSFLKLPISFPETTGCNKPCTGGVIIENF